MKEVTRQEFYTLIGRRNVGSTILARWPYTSEWKCLGTGRVFGKSIQTTEFELREHGTCGHVTSYHIDHAILASIPEIK